MEVGFWTSEKESKLDVGFLKSVTVKKVRKVKVLFLVNI